MVWILCILTLFLISCEQKPQERHYTELVVSSSQVATPEVPAIRTSKSILAWKAPGGWTEVPGGLMRMVTFHSAANPGAIDCYITALTGPAGGLEANLERWLGQLGFQASDDNVNQLATSAQMVQTKDGLEARVFDFTALQTKASPLDKSMIAAMIVLDNTTVFVKMTGTVESVKQNKANFLKLLGSITGR